MAIAKITKRFVDTVEPGSKPVFIFDEALKGFGLKVNPSGSKNFIVEYRVGAGGRLARKRRITIGSSTSITPDQARKQAKENLAAARTGMDPSEARMKERRVPDFKTFAYRYLDEEAASRLKSNTRRNYEINIRKHALPSVGAMKLNQITRAEIQNLHATLGWRSKVLANRTIETISAVYRYAQTLGLVEDDYNPTSGIKAFKEEARERYLSEAEFVRLGEALDLAEAKGIPWKALRKQSISKHTASPENQKTVFSGSAVDTIRLLIFTGCRLREILHLTWGEVDLERGLLFLADSKTGARAVVLNQLAMDILKRQHRTGEYAFPTEFDDKPRADLNKPWRAIRRHAGLEDLRLHDLRHSFASVGASAGMGLPIVGALLGHKQAATTERYAHLDASPLRQASDEIAARIASSMKVA
ncbi:MAG: tyrosine-type recombinase/integrase [Alphaproteobacteria bacterium]|nr:tyrosine-type recombinase/integrase [Alphaproteobacteria bacterium]